MVSYMTRYLSDVEKGQELGNKQIILLLSSESLPRVTCAGPQQKPSFLADIKSLAITPGTIVWADNSKGRTLTKLCNNIFLQVLAARGMLTLASTNI